MQWKGKKNLKIRFTMKAVKIKQGKMDILE